LATIERPAVRIDGCAPRADRTADADVDADARIAESARFQLLVDPPNELAHREAAQAGPDPETDDPVLLGDLR
jgi:hypothetical protein